ncbi:MAG TPA: SgcJ/EcaC family oxidoreductase [Gemmatimonadaceae bacterium]|jgi:uncharacterized protein (TIGR02246 family)|nr:SgcJ/EcaC family oxidoreductase [Gemmatimonadaceae bacterium]
MTEDEQAIRKLVESWFAASMAGDIDTVLSYMTDDVIFMTPGQEPFGKEAFAASSAKLKGLKLDGRYEIQEVQVLGDWAYLGNRIEMSVTPPGGETIRRAGYTLTIFAKGRDGRWRLSRDANMLSKVG